MQYITNEVKILPAQVANGTKNPGAGLVTEQSQVGRMVKIAKVNASEHMVEASKGVHQ